jgi:hypothetical protein
MLQGLQKTKQEPTPSAGQKEKITLKGTLKAKTYITVVRNPKSHVMNSVYKEEIFIAGVHLHIFTSS